MGILFSSKDHTDSPYRDYFISNANWMEKSISLMKGIKLRDQVMIGSHDSGTYGVKRSCCASGMAITQYLNIKQQLEHGVRYLDLRVGTEYINGITVSSDIEDQLYIWHGPASSVKFFDVIRQIAEFNQENPKEIILMKIKIEKLHKLSVEQQTLTINKIKEILGIGKIISRHDYEWFNFENVTVKDIMDKGKNYIIFFHRFGYTEDSENFNSFLKKTEEMKDNIYPLEVEKLKESIIEETKKCEYFIKERDINDCWLKDEIQNEQARKAYTCTEKYKSESSKLFSVQLILTNKASCSNICKWLCFVKTPNLNIMTANLKKSQILYKFIARSVRKELQNIISFDFIGYRPEINHYLVSSNLNVKLKIKKAFQDNEEFDHKLLEKYITRDNCLFIMDIKKTLKKVIKGSLIIGFNYTTDHEDSNEDDISFIEYKISSENQNVLITYFGQDKQQELWDGHPELKNKKVWGFVNSRNISLGIRKILADPDYDYTHTLIGISLLTNKPVHIVKYEEKTGDYKCYQIQKKEIFLTRLKEMFPVELVNMKNN